MSYHRPVHTIARGALAALVALALLTHAQRKPPASDDAPAPAWGSFETPFAAGSPWNSRPLEPVFGDAALPAAKFVPTLESGKWSTGVFHAVPGGPTVTVHGASGKPGLWRADDRTFGDVVVPRWPAAVTPASGSDGHAEIVDSTTGIVHSFWQLRREDGKWVAEQYAWTALGGMGWGDPAHPLQGARAAGVPALGGLIRTSEVDDGQALYRHALSISLPTTALAPAPAYVHPATSADKEAATVNTGSFPEGALLMLPASFDTAAIEDARIRKIAATLKAYGAYVVDRNGATGFVIYGEIGSGLELHKRAWNGKAVAELETIRQALRQVVGASGWVDGDGKPLQRDTRPNLVSMRGPWTAIDGQATASFDSWSQSLVVARAGGGAVLAKTFPEGVTEVAWARPVAGTAYEAACHATAGASCRLLLRKGENEDIVVDSGELGDKETARFTWPAGKPALQVRVRTGAAGATARVLLSRR